MLVISCSLVRADQPLDADFLEWLGQTAEVAEMGVDVESLISEREEKEEYKDEENKDKEAAQK